MHRIRTFLPLIIITIIAIAFRLWMISDHKIYFWYDQARDAVVSRSILSEFDLKVQGPSASGTDDTVYHGVLYYYLIGPLYVLANNDPYTVAIVFAVINALAVIPFYFLTHRISRSHATATLAAFLLSLNFQHAQYSSWLSNPSMALIPILVFAYAAWVLFYENTTQKTMFWTIVLAVSMGIIQQSAIYSVYFLGMVVIGFAYRAHQNKSKENHLKQEIQLLAVFSSIYLMCISTMLLTQLQLFRAGIFTPEALNKTLDRGSSFIDRQLISELIAVFADKFLSIFGPFHSIFASVVSISSLFVFWKESQIKIKIFLFSWLLSPLWLFIIQFRSSIHILVGLEYPILILSSVVLFVIWCKKNFVLQSLAVLSLLLYVVFQISASQEYRNLNTTIFTSQKGVLLEKQLELIDKTYRESNFEPFSVSFWVSPYDYYVSWIYLYDWYGMQKYGYVPTYFGASQLGKPGSELLSKSDKIGPTHFIIEEPDIPIANTFYTSFHQMQNSVSTPSAFIDTKSEDSITVGEYVLMKRKSIQE